ncbi:unnamed protein product [Enterobius vermicularis]|uniref:Secreted protein n=1 Tax=Enterobius vermicularis TaxID=51028 RepID=A0A0N4UT59_ENTVE|nr:unnamed protein product [Enterobius vermicularis]
MLHLSVAGCSRFLVLLHLVLELLRLLLLPPSEDTQASHFIDSGTVAVMINDGLLSASPSAPHWRCKLFLISRPSASRTGTLAAAAAPSIKEYPSKDFFWFSSSPLHAGTAGAATANDTPKEEDSWSRLAFPTVDGQFPPVLCCYCSRADVPLMTGGLPFQSFYT